MEETAYMNTVACIKHLLDTTDIRFDDGRLKREGQPVIINSLDEYAVEEGIRQKEAAGTGKVTVLTVGPEKAGDPLKHGIAMGADDGYHICDEALAGSDSVATARVIAAALEKIGDFDLVTFGAETVDGNTAYVGPAVAERLGLPCVTFVSKIEEAGDGKIVVQRIMEEGYDRIEMSLPAVITVVKSLNEPRISSLKGKMKAKKFKPTMWSLADLGVDAAMVGQEGATSRVTSTYPPEPRPSGQMLEGEPGEVAEQLYQALK
jgi:electron transfer flavoprotein beta subunit